MELKLVAKTGRSVVIELTDSGKFYTEKKYEIFVNDQKFMDGEKVITSLHNLKPDTTYKISVVYEGQDVAPITVKTDWEFVTCLLYTSDAADE